MSGSAVAQGWSQQTSPLGTQNLGRVQFVSSTEGWATSGNGKLIHTTDGGTNWLAVTPGLNDTVSFSSNPGYALSFVNVTTGWVIGSLGTRINPKGAVLYKTTDGGVSWSRNVISPWDGGIAVQFLDSNNGWASVATGAFPNITSAIIRTTDGGNSWSTVSSALSNKIALVQFVDSDNGWILVDSLSSSGTFIPPSQILHTTNAGSTWTLQINDSSPGWFEGLDFIDANNGWVIGDSAKIFHTTNAGTTWLQVTNTGLASSARVSAVFFLNSNLGWIASQTTGTGDVVLYTTNAGASWSLQSVNVPSTIFSISFIDPNNGWLTGGLGSIAHTTSGGNSPSTLDLHIETSWNMVSVPLTLSDYRKTILFPAAISPAFAYSGSYTMQDTLRNGIGYWVKYPDTQTVSITGTLRIRDTLLLASGWNMIGSISTPIAVAQITSDPGGIVTSPFFGYSGSYTSSDSIQPGKSYWVKVNQSGKLFLASSASTVNSSNRIKIIPSGELPPAAPGSQGAATPIPALYGLEQNYPNPFNPAATISFSLPSRSFVSLKVFDVLGREVSILLADELSAGRYARQWSAEGLPSGVYFYRMQAGSFNETKKLILLR